ncbi:HdeD family acid-resistance protein [Acinetobacter sp. MB5]|uniref:HdeD family acid-resistance protein n=1 Tax=Acinetobacter sp. MB5 TaxID=2069438 RepID=UPI000DCFDA81|nr:HdeD family acid-resistance protein [Acinetobacter sp. MB5]
MLTVGNDLVRHQLHQQRKWYLAFGWLLVLFTVILLLSLPFATLAVVVLFGTLMMLAAILHVLAAFKFFEGGVRWVWLLFAVIYFIAGFLAFRHPWGTAIFLTQIVGVILIVAGVLRIFKALLFRAFQGWGWIVFSGGFTVLTGILILITPNTAFWLLGFCLALDLFFQGINYLNLAAVIKQIPPSSADI